MRKRILETFEAASREPDLARRRELLTFVIIGAGPVGVELASSLRDLMDHTLRQMYPELDLAHETTILLLDAADRILTAMDPRLGAIAMKQLERQRIRVMLNARVSEVGEGVVRTKDGVQHRARTIVWAGGVRTHPLIAGLTGVALAKDKRLVVDRTFSEGLAGWQVCCGSCGESRPRRTSTTGRATSSPSDAGTPVPSSLATGTSSSAACPHGPSGA